MNKKLFKIKHLDISWPAEDAVHQNIAVNTRGSKGM
jgi:hypothetical protein